MNTRYPVHPHCTFKTPEIAARVVGLCDIAAEILYFMADYTERNALPFVVTDTVSTPAEDKALSRVSDEHSTGRAFDLSIHGWEESAIQAFIADFTKRYLCVAAIGKTTNLPHLIFRHNNGHGDHLHVQVGRVFALQNPLKLPVA